MISVPTTSITRASVLGSASILRELPNGCHVGFGIGDATKIALPDDSVDLVFGSPPYCDARTYGVDGVARGCADWIDFMLTVTAEACRISRGLVVWNCAGVTRDWLYWPACEGLLYEWFKRGGRCWRPVFWRRQGIPGSGGKQWFRSDVEYCLAFTKVVGPIPWSDNLAMGNPPKSLPGGPMSYRNADGVRRNDAAKRAHAEAHRDGGKRSGAPWYKPVAIANPGNMFQTAGGGNLGDDESYENEAPFPEKLPEFFIRSLCPPNGWTFDPFNGSGTTAITAGYYWRNGFGTDLRQNQIDLSARRLIRRLDEARACLLYPPATEAPTTAAEAGESPDDTPASCPGCFGWGCPICSAGNN